MGVKPLPEKNEQQLNKKQGKKRQFKKSTGRVRMFPIWLRILIVLILSMVATIAGLVFGYSVIGDGQATEVLKIDTWRHIVDIITKE